MTTARPSRISGSHSCRKVQAAASAAVTVATMPANQPSCLPCCTGGPFAAGGAGSAIGVTGMMLFGFDPL